MVLHAMHEPNSDRSIHIISTKTMRIEVSNEQAENAKAKRKAMDRRG